MKTYKPIDGEAFLNVKIQAAVRHQAKVDAANVGMDLNQYVEKVLVLVSGNTKLLTAITGQKKGANYHGTPTGAPRRKAGGSDVARPGGRHAPR